MNVNNAGYINPSDKYATSSSNGQVRGGHDVDRQQENQSSVVDLSEESRNASAVSGTSKKYVMLDSFGTPAYRTPPQPSSALEEMIYSRGRQRIDFSQSPPRWPSNNQVLDYDTWLQYERELDKQTDDRINIYEQSLVAGLSKEEIIQAIEEYNSTLDPRYIHSTEVENRPHDVERPRYQLPPSGSYTSDIHKKREESFQIMVNAMTKNQDKVKSYIG